MLSRSFYSYMLEWRKRPHKQALFIQGARQIGKTTLVRKLGKEAYQKFLEINFITMPSAKAIFQGDLSAETLIMKLTAFFHTKLIPHQTLIFFDEAQECPEVRTAIKFLVEDGRYDYIESGSLLGVAYQSVASYPVGFEDVQTMYPMDFQEFALALGVQPEIWDQIESAYQHKIAVDDYIHEQMMEIFTYYCVVGGMPAVVDTFIHTHDIGEVVNLQKSILALYRKDIQKYAHTGKDKIQMIFDSIPSELNQKNKRFKLSDLKKSARSERYESCFNWLNDAGVTLPCYNLQEIHQPVRINCSRNLFKLFMNDVGLLCAMSSLDIQFQIIHHDYHINEGCIMENMAAQTFVSNGYHLYYYDRKKLGEIDFVLECGSQLQPIEIKSGKDYYKHAALDRLMDQKDLSINKPIVFSIGNVEDQDRICYLPLYMMVLLKNEHTVNKVNLNFDILFPGK